MQTMNGEYQKQLSWLVAESAPADSQQWLQQACDDLKSSTNLSNDLSMYSAMAMRKLGPNVAKPHTIETTSGLLSVDHWSLGDIGRMVLLLESAQHAGTDWVSITNTMFRNGDEGERAAITSGLVLLPSPAKLKPLALEAGRVNSLRLFSALALQNPYAAANYNDHEFNQLVLKAIFTELAVEMIVGLEQRANQELSRMCEDYIDERVAAGRDIPVDIWLALAPYASERGEKLLSKHLHSSDARHQHYAQLATQHR